MKSEKPSSEFMKKYNIKLTKKIIETLIVSILSLVLGIQKKYHAITKKNLKLS